MYAVEKLSQYITQGVYTVSGPFHPFGGAVDVIVVQQQDGSFKSSPWYVKFGKVQGVPKTKEKLVCICVNGDEASFHMYLDHKGETYFLREVDGQEEDSIFFLPSSGDETDEKSHNERQTKTKSLSIDDKKHNSVKQIDMGNGKVLTRTNSKRTRFLGLMFGRKSLKDDNRQRKGEGNVDRISSLERAEIAADLLDVKWSTSLRTDKVIPSRDGSRTCNSGKPELEGLNNERDLVENLNEELQFNIKDELYSPVKDHQFSCNPPIDGSVNSVDIVTKPNILESNDSIAFKPVSKLSSSEAFDLVGGVGVRREGAIEREDCSDVENRKDSKELNADVCRLINVETTESSIFETRDLKDQLEENTIGSEKVEIGTEILLPEINSCPISGGITSEENFGGSHCSGSGIPNHIDSGVLEATQQCRVAEGHFKEKALGTNTEDTFAKEPQFAAGDFTSELRFGNDHGVVAQEASVPPDAATVDQMLHSATEEPRAISNIYHVSNLRSQTRLIDNSQEVKVHKLQIMSAPTQESDIEPPSEKIGSPHMHLFQTMEQDQLLFGEIDNVLLNSIQLDENHVNEVDHDSLLSSSNQSFGSPLTNGSASHQEELNQASALCASVLQEPKILSSQIAIPINQIHVEKVKELVQSLPNIQGDIHDLNHRRSHHYLSRSLDSAESLMIVNHGENCLDSFKSKSASEGNFRDILCSRFENTNVMEEGLGLPKKEFTLPHPPVELSLCRHLLSEGMGAEAASLAFDSEKVDLEKFTSLGPSVVKNESLVVRISGCYFPWESAGPIILGMVSFGQECIFKPEGAIHVEKPEKSQRESGVSANGNWSIWPFSFRRSKTIACVPEKPLDDTIYRGEILDGVKNANEVNVKAIKKVRSIVPTSEQLASLILKEGRNMVTFTFSTAMLGKQQVDARIYLWKWNTKIVVSDVDGTITKSDVLGQFMPLMGKDWSHTGVAHLFSAIKENGYEMLFLSARAISQAHLTRQFLFNLKQDGKALPDGPVVISPDGLFPSLYREVIRRAPHEFKISCLEDIRALFPFDCNPFYAGFGNRHTDEISYLKVGIPRGKIFTINARGEVAVSRQVDRKSYTSLHTLVHDMFPARTSSEQEEFNSWNYWRMPIPEIDI